MWSLLLSWCHPLLLFCSLLCVASKRSVCNWIVEWNQQRVQVVRWNASSMWFHVWSYHGNGNRVLSQFHRLPKPCHLPLHRLYKTDETWLWHPIMARQVWRFAGGQNCPIRTFFVGSISSPFLFKHRSSHVSRVYSCVWPTPTATPLGRHSYHGAHAMSPDLQWRQSRRTTNGPRVLGPPVGAIGRKHGWGGMTRYEARPHVFSPVSVVAVFVLWHPRS